MLILGRNVGEAIVIAGRTIRIEVLRIDGGEVKLGITAPREIDVHREEVQDAIDRGEQR